MCLLVEQKASTKFTDEFLIDVYAKNRDGLGIMFADAGDLIVRKILPRNADDFVKYFREYADGRDCIWHARMQTHGDIDLDNCHPYMVTKNVWMAHNGILSSGNDNDRSKSDTWHFIRNIIEPAVAYQPDLLLSPDYQAFIGDLIGNSNKFGFMTGSGQSVIINRSAGVTYQGAWLSNTYAWSASKFGVGVSASTRSSLYSGYSGYKNGYSSKSTYGYYDWESGYTYDTKSKSVSHTSNSIKPIVKAAYNSWLNNNLEQWVLDAPWKAGALLDYIYESDDSEEFVADDPGMAAQYIEELFVNDELNPTQL
jgi:hypothetical protein